MRGMFTGRIDSVASERQLVLHLNTEHRAMRLSGTVRATPTVEAIQLTAIELSITNSDGVAYTITEMQAEIPLNTAGVLLPIGGLAKIGAANEDASPPTIVSLAP